MQIANRQYKAHVPSTSSVRFETAVTFVDTLATVQVICTHEQQYLVVVFEGDKPNRNKAVAAAYLFKTFDECSACINDITHRALTETLEQFTPKQVAARLYVTQKDNDRYFNQKMSTWRNGYTYINRTVCILPDPDGVYDAGDYGHIVVGGRDLAVIGGSSGNFEVLRWA